MLSPGCTGLGRTNSMPWRSAAGSRTSPWLARSIPGEAHLVGGAQKLAGEIVGPAVIGTGEGPRVAAARGHRRAAMAADVGEGHHPPVGAAGHQHRHAGHVLGEIVAGLGQPRGEAHEDRLVAEQPLALQAGALAAGIGRDAVAEHVARQVGRAAVDMSEQSPPDGQFFLSFHGGILVLRWGRATPVARLLMLSWTASVSLAHDHERAGGSRSGRS